MTPLELQQRLQKAQAQVRAWGAVSEIEGNIGWAALQESFRAEAKLIAERLIQTVDDLTAKGTDAVTVAVAVMSGFAQWRAVLRVADHVLELKEKAREAEAFLESVRTRE